MTYHAINGLRYHAVEAGQGRPLVLLHGFTGSAAAWDHVLPELAARRRVIAVDLPGHGRSDAPAEVARYGMGPVAADLAELLRRLDAAPADWLGYSMGGRLALYVAATRPELVRALVLESASPGLATEAERAARRDADEALAAGIERDGLAAFVDRWERLPLFATQAQLSPATRDHLRAQRLANDPQGLAGSLRGMGTGAQPSLWDRLANIDRPTLLLAGELDEKFVAINRAMAARWPGARLAVVAGAGHTIHLERPAAFVAAVGRFLDERGEQVAGAEQDGKGQRGQ